LCACVCESTDAVYNQRRQHNHHHQQQQQQQQQSQNRERRQLVWLWGRPEALIRWGRDKIFSRRTDWIGVAAANRLAAQLVLPVGNVTSLKRVLGRYLPIYIILVLYIYIILLLYIFYIIYAETWLAKYFNET